MKKAKSEAMVHFQHRAFGCGTRAWGTIRGKMKPEQPGINGIQYAQKLGYIYYTATAKKLFMRARVNPETLDAIGEPEHVSAGRMADDFCIDEDAGVAYVTTQREKQSIASRSTRPKTATAILSQETPSPRS